MKLIRITILLILYIILLQMLFFWLGEKFVYSGASYPEAIPTIRIVMIIVYNIFMVFRWYGPLENNEVTLRNALINFPGLLVIWSLLYVVIFLYISFAAMISSA